MEITAKPKKWLPTLLTLVIVFLVGVAVGHYRFFPYRVLVWSKTQLWKGMGLDPTPRMTGQIYDSTQFKRKVKCPSNPITLLTFGQSNAGNHLMGARTALPHPGVVNFYQGQCYKLEDPVLGASGTQGSLWTTLAQEIYQKTGRDVLVLSHAIGGSQIALWEPEHKAGYFQLLLNNVKALEKSGLKIQTVIFHQGEADLALGTPPETYQARLNRVFDATQKSLQGEQRILLFGAASCYGHRSDKLAEAQKAVAQARPDTQFVFSTDELSAPYRFDGCHFNHHGVETIVKELLPYFVELQTDQN